MFIIAQRHNYAVNVDHLGSIYVRSDTEIEALMMPLPDTNDRNCDTIVLGRYNSGLAAEEVFESLIMAIKCGESVFEMPD